MDRATPRQLEAQAAGTLPGVRWVVRLLGRVEARGPAGTVDHWHSRAVAELLARLALEPGRDHPREELATLLWPEADAEAARRRLRQALSILRRQLQADGAPDDPWLQADRLAIRVAPGALDSDVARFSQSLREGDHAAAAEAWGGEFMPGHYSEWVLDERARLLALHDRVQAAPPRDMAPRPAAAHDAPARWADTAPTVLPTYWTRAHGLQASVAEVQRRLREGRQLTIVGTGGMGKTRLAVEAARGPDGPGPAHFVSLVDVGPATALWETLAAALTPGAARASQDHVLARCARLQGLLVLDNAELLEPEAVEAVALLARQSPQLAVLVTSRRPLGLDGEQLLSLQGLAAPPADDPAARPEDFPALALFLDRTRAARADFHLTAGNRDAVLALVRLLGGQPLAIELAAPRLRALHPRDLLRHLTSGEGSPMLDLLARPGARGGRAQRHASMREVLAWSWRQLSPAAQRLLSTLAVPRAPVSWPAAGALWDDASSLPGLIAELVDASLLQSGAPVTDDDTTLLWTTQPVREFALEQAPPNWPATVRRRLRAWLTTVFEARLPREHDALVHERAHLPELLRSTPEESDDVVGAETLVALAWSAMSTFSHTMPRLGMFEAWSQAMHRLDAAGGAQRARCRARLMLAHFGHDPGRARAHATEAIALADLPEDRAFGRALQAVAEFLADGDVQRALEGLAVAEDEARRTGALRVLAAVLRMQSAVLVNFRQDYAAAEARVAESLAISRARGDEALVALREIDLATWLCAMGREAEGMALFETCLDRSRRWNAESLRVVAQQQVGRMHLLRRRWAAAETALREVEACLRPLGYTPRHEVLAHLGEAWLMQGRGAREAALLLGHGEAAWRRLGPINPIQSRELRRTRRKLCLALGSARSAHTLLAQGAALSVAEVDALVDRVHAAIDAAP